MTYHWLKTYCKNKQIIAEKQTSFTKTRNRLVRIRANQDLTAVLQKKIAILMNETTNDPKIYNTIV
jgi:hypothetical protein